MAGDWLKMRTRLAEERSVMLICDLTGLDTFSVVGRLHAIWSWAGEHTTNGEVKDVTLKTIDRVTNFSGFAEAMRSAKWLEIADDGTIRFPEWKKYNSKAAKRRALDAARQARRRAKIVTQKSRIKRDGERDENVTVTHQEKSREEERRVEKNTTPNGVEDIPATSDPASEVFAAWNAADGTVKARIFGDTRRNHTRVRLADSDWRWREALAKFPLPLCESEPDGWKPDFDWFVRPDSVNKILEGKYDWKKGNTNGSRTPTAGQLHTAKPLAGFGD